MLLRRHYSNLLASVFVISNPVSRRWKGSQVTARAQRFSVICETRLVGFRVGGIDYVSKPFQDQEVLARVKTHLRLRQMQVELVSNNRSSIPSCTQPICRRGHNEKGQG